MKNKGKIVEVIQNIVTLQVSGKPPKKGDYVTIQWGRKRSLPQNSFYWAMLTWVLEQGDTGYLTPEELHDDLKGRFLAVKADTGKGFVTVRIKSTTDLDSNEFSEYIDKCDKAINSYLGIDTSEFHREYQELYGKH